MPFIIMMSFGMGLTFVPVTLTAVHHLRSEESGHRLRRAQHRAAGRRRARPRRAGDGRDADLHRPRQGVRRRPRRGLPQPSPEQAKAFAEIAQQQIFTEGSTNAFLVGSILMLAASVVIWIFLDVKHEELATDGPEGVVAH